MQKKSVNLILFLFCTLTIIFCACQKQLDYSASDIADLKASVAALQKRSDSLAAALAATNNNISSISKSLDSIRNQLGIITLQINQLTTQITSINANITNINIQINLLNQQYSDLLAQLNKLLSQLTLPSLTNGLIVYYPFSGNANDLSGNNLNASLNNTTLTKDRFGNINSAYLFDGISSFINTPIIEKGFSNISVSLWFKTSVGGQIYQGSRIINSYPNSQFGTRMDIIPTNATGLYFGSDGDGYTDGVGTNNNNYTDNNWHHVIGIWSSNNSTKINPSQFKIYIDGILVPQTTKTSVGFGGLGDHALIPLNGTNTLIIGKWRTSNSNSIFSGSIDEFRYYNRILTQTEITYLASH